MISPFARKYLNISLLDHGKYLDWISLHAAQHRFRLKVSQYSLYLFCSFLLGLEIFTSPVVLLVYTVSVVLQSTDKRTRNRDCGPSTYAGRFSGMYFCAVFRVRNVSAFSTQHFWRAFKK